MPARLTSRPSSVMVTSTGCPTLKWAVRATVAGIRTARLFPQAAP
jgi:hypothetical protein